MEMLSISENTVKMLKKDAKILKEVRRRGEVEVALKELGLLEIEGEGGKVWIATQVLKALDFGFKPQQAYKLFSDNYFLEIIDLELVFSNPKAIDRYKGRVIGSEGRAKHTLQELSGAFISISGNKIAVLGEFDDLQMAKEGILRILEGAPHTAVYAFLERKSKERKYALK